ncbi:MAG: AI-2E family transporter [Thermaerobacter sp.]|nr:AI-2E family transporter [Thermaerobacter sp.]
MKKAGLFDQGPLRWYRWGLLFGLVAGGAWLLWAVRAILLPFIFALVLAYLLAPTVDGIVRYARINRVAAIFAAYALVGVTIAVAAIYLIPLLLQESLEVIHLVPNLVTGAQSGWNAWLIRFHQAPIPPAARNAITQTGAHLQGKLWAALRQVISAMFGLVPGVVSVVVAPVLGFYLLKDLDRVRARFWQVVPVNWQEAVYKLGFDVDGALSGFIRGQLLVALAVGLLSTVWVAMLGIPFSALIGVVAGVTDVIPYVGPIAGAIPAVLLGLNRSPLIALYAGAGFVAIHQLEGTVIAPKVVGDSVGLHPLAVIFAILAGGELAGVAGLLLGVPLAAVLKVVLSHLYNRVVIALDRPSSGSVE